MAPARVLQSLSSFAVVGAFAALVHYVCAVSLQGLQWLPAAQANIVAFLIAFPVSYIGHRRWSFAHQAAEQRQSLPRFFVVAIMGFLVNQWLLLSLLHFTMLPFWLVLAVVMLVVALMTYLLSRFWAFHHG